MECLVDQFSIVLNNMQKLKAEGEPDGFFDKKIDLPIIANAPTFSVDDINKPIDTSVIDKMGQSTRSEDIALARSQGLDVDDDNEPAPGKHSSSRCTY
jgi:hypothetical protein